MKTDGPQIASTVRGFMTRNGQSRKEAVLPIAILSTKATTKIGTWNVRTMYEAGKAIQIANEMEAYGLDILGISEARWTGSGHLQLDSGMRLLYSGHEDVGAPHTEGVALMLSKKAQKSFIGWKPHGSRLMEASFRTKHKRIKLNIINCYSPTNESDETNKELFYSRLQAILDTLSSRDINIVLGDFNAKVGSDNTGYEEFMGVQGIGVMNDNGERFANMCASNNFVIGGTIFQHKNIHKATWISPDHQTENQIDHVCISKKFRRSLQDVRVMRGADVGSDHQLVVAKLRMKLKRNGDGENCQRFKYNTTVLNDNEIQKEFSITLSNRVQAFQYLEEETIDDQWNKMKEIVTSTCEEVLGRKKRVHKDWITPDTLKLVTDRKKKKAAVNVSHTRLEKARAQEAYAIANRRVKNSIKAEKRNFVSMIATEAEEAARHGNMRDLYNTTKKLSRKAGNSERPIKDKQGRVLQSEEEQKKRWKDHFEELLNRPAPVETPDIEPAEEDLPIKCDVPNKEEIKKAIGQLKNGKAAGPDNIPAEALKADTDTMVEILYPLFKKIWQEKRAPVEWKEGHLVKLPKKGDLSDCANYRGITLLSVPGKVFSRILLNRMKDAVDPVLRDQQAGFRKNRSCTDQIATLRIILEQSQEWNSSLYINFLDYEKAFDSVDRETLWKLLRHYGIPEEITSIIKILYDGLTCRVIHGKQLTDAFPVKTGVRQGCLLSPFLFLLAIDWIMNVSTKDRHNGIQWTPWTQLEDLDFADDIVLFSHDHNQMQEKTKAVASNSEKLGLRINQGKSKLLKVNISSPNPIRLGTSTLEEVKSFTYLGSIVDKQGGTDADVKVRINKARTAFHLLRNIWSSRDLSYNTKIRLFNTNVKSVLLYGAETWRTTVCIQKKIQTFINTCLRGILRIRWPEIITNEDLWRTTKQRPVEAEIKQRRWRWIGHTLRKPVASVTRQSLMWNPKGKRRRGRPRNTWCHEMEADIQKMGSTWDEIVTLARDRTIWRNLVDGLCSMEGRKA